MPGRRPSLARRGPGSRRPPLRARSARVVLRTYRRADFPSVQRLWKEGGIRLNRSDSASAIARSLRRDPELFLIAERRGAVVGVVLGRYDGRRGWANHLAVAPSLRSRGIGTALMRELERRLRRKGCPKLNLHVERENRAVSAFYEGIGYRLAPLLFLEKWLVPRPGRTGGFAVRRSPGGGNGA